MGCGTSSDKLVSQETIQKFGDNCVILYAESRSRKFVDISGNLNKDFVILPENQLWSYDLEVWKSLLQVAEKFSQVVFVIDVLSVEFFYLDQQIVMLTMDAENNKINQDKFMFLFLVPTSQTDQGFAGPAGWCFKSAFSTLVQQPSDPTAFVDRGVWYQSSSDYQKVIAGQCIQRLQALRLEKSVDREHLHCFYPAGFETFKAMKELNDNIVYEIWNRRKFVFHIIFQSHSEQIIEFCLELYQAQIMSKQYDNLLQLQGFNMNPQKLTNKKPVLSYPKHEKIIVALGEQSLKLAQLIKGGQHSDLAGILENERQGLKNFLYLVDLSVTKQEAQELVVSKFLDTYLDDIHFIVILIPAKKENWPLCLPFVLTAIKSCQMTIFLNEENRTKNSEFLNVLIDSETSFNEINMHLCPYPRLHFFIPTFQGKSIVQIPGIPESLDLKENSNLGAAISFGNNEFPLPESKAVSAKQFINNFIRLPGNGNEGYGIAHSSLMSQILREIGALEAEQVVNLNETHWGNIVDAIQTDWIEVSLQLTELYKDYLYAFYNFDSEEQNISITDENFAKE